MPKKFSSFLINCFKHNAGPEEDSKFSNPSIIPLTRFLIFSSNSGIFRRGVQDCKNQENNFVIGEIIIVHLPFWKIFDLNIII